MGMLQYKVQILGSAAVTGPDGNAFTYIQPKGVCRHMEISETTGPGYAGGAIDFQGFNYKLPNDNFATVYAQEPGGIPILLNDQVQEGKGSGRMLGHPQVGNVGMPSYNPATIIVKIASATIVGTWVLVKEYS